MKADWLPDGRKIPDEVMNYIRRLAVRVVEEKGYSAEAIADIFGISRSSLYEWLRGYRVVGEAALDTRLAPGVAPVMTAEMDRWLRATVLNSTPVDHGYDTLLWTRALLAAVLQQQFGIQVAASTVGLHWHRLGLSSQVPRYRAREQDPAQVVAFLEVKFPKIQKLADRLGADIGFADEAGVGLRTCSGRTWGEVGQPPEVVVTDQRGGYNVLSIITAAGALRYSLDANHINGQRYVAFLQQLLRGRTRPLILIADQVSFHRSAVVRQFVRAHCRQLRVFFFSTHSPELNPDEQVWNDIKYRRLGRQPVKNKTDLKHRLRSTLNSLQHKAATIRSFFHLPDTRYAAIPEAVSVT